MMEILLTVQWRMEKTSVIVLCQTNDLIFLKHKELVENRKLSLQKHLRVTKL